MLAGSLFSDGVLPEDREYKMRSILIIAIIGIYSLCFAESMTQTDWSGGPGEIIPVFEWLDSYRASSGTDDSTPGEIGLGISFEKFEGITVGTDYGDLGDPVLADFDGDGDLDIICDDFSDWKFSIFMNLDGVGGEWEKHVIFDLPWPPTRCSMPIDLDQDGDIDLLTACGHYFTYWENTDGSGLNWDEYVLQDAHEAFDLLCFDIDNDGDNDVIGCSNLSNNILSWENLDGSGHQWTERTISQGKWYPSDLSMFDYDGDLDIDFFCSWEDSKEICLYENTGAHTWTERVVLTDLVGLKGVHVADFDNDGDVDIAVFSIYDENEVYENIDGSCTEWELHLLPRLAENHHICYDANIADLDFDGDIDIFGSLIATSGSGMPKGMFVFENAGASCDRWVYHMFVEHDTDYCRFHDYGDVNGDGNFDFPCIDITIENIMWFDIMAPADTGWVESSVLQVSDTDWGSIDWSADLPTGTSVFFQVRSSMDWEDMGEWSIQIEEPGSLEDLLEDGDLYVQYLATITREESSHQPRLNDVTLEWFLGIESLEENCTRLFILSPSGNNVSAKVSLEKQSIVTITVYDMAGRAVVRRDHESLSEGYNEVHLGSLVPGVYLCRMNYDDTVADARFVVIE